MQNATKTTKIPRVAFHLDSSSVSSNNGGSHVYLRVRIDRKYCYFPTHIYIPPEHWDKKAKKVRHVKGHRNSLDKELQLDELRSTMRTAIADLIKAGKPLTERSLKNRWGLQSQETFEEFAKHILVTRKKHLKQRSKYSYLSVLAKIRQFDQGIRLSQMTSEWVQDFTDWLRAEKTENGKPFKNNTVVLYLAKIRCLLKMAKKSGLIQHDPFEDLSDRPRIRKTKREFLSEEEILRLHTMYVQGDFLEKATYSEVLPRIYKPSSFHNMVQVFLVSVYTGLRLSDVRKVDEYLIGDSLYLNQQKTQEPIKLKMIERLKEIMVSPDKVLNAPVLSQARISKMLPVIFKAAGIHRRITFHASRHTFATVLLGQGVNLKVVSQLLGHTKIATTDLYTHISDKQREEGISKLDLLGSREAPLQEIKAILARYPELANSEECRSLFGLGKV